MIFLDCTVTIQRNSIVLLLMHELLHSQHSGTMLFDTRVSALVRIFPYVSVHECMDQGIKTKFFCIVQIVL